MTTKIHSVSSHQRYLQESDEHADDQIAEAQGRMGVLVGHCALGVGNLLLRVVGDQHRWILIQFLLSYVLRNKTIISQMKRDSISYSKDTSKKIQSEFDTRHTSLQGRDPSGQQEGILNDSLA